MSLLNKKTFSLVKFDNQEYFITPTRKVKIINGKQCIVKYRGSGYLGHMINENDSKEILEEEKKVLENILNSSCSPENKPIQDKHFIPKKLQLCSPSIDRNIDQLNNLLQFDNSFVEINSTEITISQTSIESIDLSSGSDVIKNIDESLLNYALNLKSSEKYLSPATDQSSNTELTGTKNDDKIEKMMLENGETELENRKNVEERVIEQTGNYGENELLLEIDNEKSLHNCSNRTVLQDITNETMELSEPFSSNNDTNRSSDYMQTDNSLENSENQSANVSSILTWSENANHPVDERKLTVPASKNNSKPATKKYFCHFCKTLQAKFARHMELKHKNERDVRKYMSYPKKSSERKKMIEKIRKYGNYLHNTNSELNTGILITERRPQQKYDSKANNFCCCSYCGGFYSKSTLRVHYNNCNKNHVKGIRGLIKEGKEIAGFSHSRAGVRMRRKILPKLKNDDIGELIKYDLLLNLIGNRLCEKRTLIHEEDSIRNDLRLLSRLTLAAKNFNSKITDYASIFHPMFFDDVIKGIKHVASYDEDKQIYKTPYNAVTLGILVKMSTTVLSAELVKKEDRKNLKKIEEFKLLFQDEFPVINKKVLEDQSENRRMKKVKLPSQADIKTLYMYIKNICEKALETLKNSFQFTAWKDLCEGTLILLLTFNCRRPGEIERSKLQNYENKETIDKAVNSDLYNNISEDAQGQARQFVRFLIRGKRKRDVPVLLHNFLVDYMDTIIHYRCNAGVSPNNEYIFAIPGVSSKAYLRACGLMRKFSSNCGAKEPSTLRATLFRKRVATYTAMLGIAETQVSNLANFMGHDSQIHKNVYRVPNGVIDMTEVSRLLEAAMGADDGDDDNNCFAEDMNEPSEATMNVECTKPTRENEIISESVNFDDPQPSTSQTACVSINTKTPRMKWSDEEREIVEKKFGSLKQLAKLPSRKQCQSMINEYGWNRTADQLKSWIDNQRKSDARKKKYYENKANN